MIFTKISNGRYEFKGIDNWTNKEIEGLIIHVDYDVPLSRAWQVVFGEGTNYTSRPFQGKSLKSCKHWLTK